MSDRLECYAAIRDCMKTRLMDYYSRNKSLLGDERSQAAVKESLEGLECIFSVLDKFDISKKPETKDEK